MNRLTERDWKSKCEGYPWNVHPVKDIDDLQYYKKLAEYEDEDEQGLLFRLPCKVGTEVYNITWWDDVQEKVVVKGKTYYRTVHKHKVTKSTFSYFDVDEFGKTIFLTREEAEAKLKEMEGGKDGK